MGVFLRFGEENRLIEDRSMPSGNYGAMDPKDAFPGAEHGDEFLEVHPRVLEKLRPSALHKLRGHCILTREGLKVDQLSSIRSRLMLQKKHRIEERLLGLAVELGQLRLAKTVLLQCFPASGQARILALEKDIAGLKSGIRNIDQLPIDEGEMLRDLAGKVVRI